MTAFETVITDVFRRGAEIRLSVEEEATAIAGAKLGHEPAVLKLIYAYAPALRRAVRRYRDILGADDAHSLAVEGLLNAVHAYDSARSDRLASLIAETVARHLSEAAMTSESAWSIPERTLSRFYSIMRTAGGDAAAAEELAQEKGMSREVFLDIVAAIRGTNSLDQETHNAEHGSHGETSAKGIDARPLWGDREAFAEAEDRLMTDIALGAIEGLEDVVTRLSYGFTTGEPLSDSAIVAALAEEILGDEAALAGQTVVSRPTVQRSRASALATMRDALGA